MSHHLCWEDVNVGMDLPVLSKVATTQMLVRFAGASGDFNPLHYEDAFAVAAGQLGPIVHGQCKRAWLVQLVVDWAGDPGALKKLSCRFKATDLPRSMKTTREPHDGETWMCKGKVTKMLEKDGSNLVDCEIWVENGRGEKTTTGNARVALPSRQTS